MNVLLLCDDYWHPGDVASAGVASPGYKGYTFDIIYNAADFSADMLGNYNVVMLIKCNQKSQTEKEPWITPVIERAFADYVENGGGLLFIHSGTVIDEKCKMLRDLAGCHFTYHPNVCPVTVAPILPHPVTEGIGTFCEIDEHYRLEITRDDTVAVMASYSAAQGEESKYEEDPYHNTPQWLGAACLVHSHGKGRVCVLTPGHTSEVWANAEFQKVLGNALKWCGG